jgi:uncharacterized membrane protein
MKEAEMNEAQGQIQQHFKLPGIRRVGLDRPVAWLRSGWKDLRANPVASLAYGLLFAIGGDLILIFSWRSPYLITAAVSGFFLVAPLLAGGLYEISRRQSNGQPSTFIDSLAAWRRNGQSIAMFGLLMALAAIIWERTSAVFFALFVPGLTPDLWAFASSVLLNLEHIELTLTWFFVGGLLATLVFSVSAVSIPMVIDRDVDFITAMITSLRAVMNNPGTMLLWAALVVMLTLLGFASLLFGLIILMPLLGHASWHAYRDLVE